MKISKIFAVAAVFCTVLATSCTKETPVPTAMSLDKTTVDMFVGQTVCVSPQFTPSNAKATSLVWTSSDDKVATVNGGYVEGIKAGTATITGKAQGTITATCTVTVKNVEAESFTLDKTDVTLYENEDGVTLTATVLPYNVTFPEVTWSSSNEAVATVTEKGEVKPVAIGNAVITASLISGKTVTCKVKVTLRVPTEPETLTFWKNDAASYRGLFGAAADEGKTAGKDGWLSYSDGIAYWTKNDTGAPRTATLTLSTGSSITINQCGVESIVGDYIFYNYSFNALANTTKVDNAGRKHETTVTFSAVAEPEELEGHIHNLNLTGLYYDAVVPASLEYTENGPKIYTYLTNLSYQKVSTDDEVAIIPEMSENASYSNGHFADLTFGPKECNYAWPAWNIVDVFTDPKIAMGSGDDRLVSEGLWFCGFSVVKKGYAKAGYTTIYQLNYQNKWTYEAGGAYFQKAPQKN